MRGSVLYTSVACNRRIGAVPRCSRKLRMAAVSSGSDQYLMDSADLRALMDACIDAIVVIDKGGKIRAFNAAAERLFGYRAADVVGKGVETLLLENSLGWSEGRCTSSLS